MAFVKASSSSTLGRQNAQFNGQITSEAVTTKHVETDSLTATTATFTALVDTSFSSLDFSESVNIGVDASTALSTTADNTAIGASAIAGHTITVTAANGAFASYLTFDGVDDTISTNNTYRVVYTVAAGARSSAQADIIRDPDGDAVTVASGAVPLTVTSGIHFTITSGPSSIASGPTIDIVATPDATSAIAIGSDAATFGDNCIAIGSGAFTSANSIAIGSSAHVFGTGNLFLRVGTSGRDDFNAYHTGGDNTIVIGSLTGNGSNNNGSIMLGNQTNVNGSLGNKSVHISGFTTHVNSAEAVSIGYGATLPGSGTNGIAIGSGASIDGNSSIAIGHLANTNAQGAICIGSSATALTHNELNIRFPNTNALRTNISTDGTAGAVATYLELTINGVQYKMPLHALA